MEYRSQQHNTKTRLKVASLTSTATWTARCVFRRPLHPWRPTVDTYSAVPVLSSTGSTTHGWEPSVAPSAGKRSVTFATFAMSNKIVWTERCKKISDITIIVFLDDLDLLQITCMTFHYYWTSLWEGSSPWVDSWWSSVSDWLSAPLGPSRFCLHHSPSSPTPCVESSAPSMIWSWFFFFLSAW